MCGIVFYTVERNKLELKHARSWHELFENEVLFQRFDLTFLCQKMAEGQTNSPRRVNKRTVLLV